MGQKNSRRTMEPIKMAFQRPAAIPSGGAGGGRLS